MITPLKTVLLCENTFSRFDNDIEEGRNLITSDFTLTAPEKPISVVLGSAYKGVYEIGDILSLQLISEIMNFQVVGFYKSGVGFSMDAGALHHVSLDYTIIMPHFIPDYEPVGEAAIFQHAFHLAELTSGCIAITEPITELNEDTHARYMAIVEEMANKNGLSSLYKFPYWPGGFVW